MCIRDRLKECGISGVMFEGYDENLYRMCKEAGLEAHFWKWTMNRAELLNVHPDWFAVNRKGESTHDKPAYVNYYRFLSVSYTHLIFFFFSLPVGAQSIFQKYERFLTEPRSYVCYRTDGKLKIDGKLDEVSWQKAKPTAPFVDISGEGFPTPKYETTAKMLWDDEYLYIGAMLQAVSYTHLKAVK